MSYCANVPVNPQLGKLWKELLNNMNVILVKRRFNYRQVTLRLQLYLYGTQRHGKHDVSYSATNSLLCSFLFPQMTCIFCQSLVIGRFPSSKVYLKVPGHKNELLCFFNINESYLAPLMGDIS